MAREHSFFDERAETWEADNPVPQSQLRRVIDACRLQPGLSVLDVGTGTGRLIPLILAEIGEKGEVTGLDPSAGMLQEATEKHDDPRVDLVQSTAEEIPLQDESYDRVICYAVYPHFSCEDTALRQLHRVLLPDGLLVVAHSEGRDTINQTHRHAGREVAEDRLPPADQVAERMKSVGLQVQQSIDDPDFYLVVGRK